MFSFFFSSRRRHTRCSRDWSSDVCSSDLVLRSWRRALASASGWLPAEKAFHHLLGSANPRCSYEHRGHRGHLLAVGLLSLGRSEEHTSELQSRLHLVCRLLLEKKKTK